MNRLFRGAALGALLAASLAWSASAQTYTGGRVPLVNGGTGQSAVSAQALAYALKLPYVIAQSGVAVTNTGIGTSEVNMASIPIPALGASDSLRITLLWDTSGSTASNAKSAVARLSTSACGTPLAACSAGSLVSNLNLNSASSVSAHAIVIVRNAGATNAQVFHTAGIGSIGVSASASGSAAIETNAGSYLNIDSNTSASSSDTIKLLGYTVELIPGA